MSRGASAASAARRRGVRGSPSVTSRPPARRGAAAAREASPSRGPDGPPRGSRPRSAPGGRPAARPTPRAEHVVLEGVLLVEDDHRHRGPVVAAPAAPALGEAPARPPARSAGRRARSTEQPCTAVGSGSPRPALAAAQQARRRTPGPRRAAGARRPASRRRRAEHVAEPGGQRVGVHRHRQVDRGRAGRQGRARLVVAAAGSGGPSRSSTSPAAVGRHGVVRCTTTWPTADSRARIRWLTARRRHVQVPGRGLEGAVVGDRHERGQLRGSGSHEAMLMDLTESFAGLHLTSAPSVRPRARLRRSPACSPGSP